MARRALLALAFVGAGSIFRLGTLRFKGQREKFPSDNEMHQSNYHEESERFEDLPGILEVEQFAHQGLFEFFESI